MAHDSRLTQVQVDFSIPRLNLFHRRAEAPSSQLRTSWDLAAQLVDYGCALLAANQSVRTKRRTRDLILLTCVRRSLVTTEGIVRLLDCGLLEPAHGLVRTQHELELTFDLVSNDSTDNMARRFAAYMYKEQERHLKAQLESEVVLAEFAKYGGREQREAALHRTQRYLNTREIAEVLPELRRQRTWHGMRGAEEAFKSVGRTLDYLLTYSTASWNLHGSNLESDILPQVDRGMTFKSLYQSDSGEVQSHLAQTLFLLYRLLKKWIRDRGWSEDPAGNSNCSITFADGRIENIGPMAALYHLLMNQFGPATLPEWSTPDGS